MKNKEPVSFISEPDKLIELECVIETIAKNEKDYAIVKSREKNAKFLTETECLA